MKHNKVYFVFLTIKQIFAFVGKKQGFVMYSYLFIVSKKCT